MLVLTRGKIEELVVGDNIIVKVLKVQGNRVTLGIEAPQSMPVDRGEDHEQKKRERDAKCE